MALLEEYCPNKGENENNQNWKGKNNTYSQNIFDVAVVRLVGESDDLNLWDGTGILV